MPFLLIPLALCLVAVLLAALVPLGLWQRYRLGKSRRRALPWLLRLNGWLMLASTCVFVASAWLVSHWIDHALGFAWPGLLAGLLLGLLGAWTTRFEQHAGALHYTPNRWLILMLTLLVVARLVLGLWQAFHASAIGPNVSPALALLTDHGSLFAVGGVVIGHALAYVWCLRWRIRTLAMRPL